MKKLPGPTRLEKTAGSLPVEGVATIIAAIAGGPLAALLPVLSNSLAGERLRRRIEAHLTEVSRELQEQREALRNLSDAQYKLLNEAVLAFLQTTQAEKLEILRTVVRRSLVAHDVEPQEAIMLSRIIRDITAEEAQFVVEHFSNRFVLISDQSVPPAAETLYVQPGSRDELIVAGLASLGVLSVGQPTYGQALRFSQITGKLIVLLTAY
ncbi:hypothetical protein [Aromatoleum evansii]|uniref:hypothetical protein n=1 Tax=Aromatoleum evansii TaxID=59406 RepID=UPI00145DF538|nr:hypothetical protein [Aromatoleum evansii]NMG29352.1 hypothetical protein [Aromatoleum evansii]